MSRISWEGPLRKLTESQLLEGPEPRQSENPDPELRRCTASVFSSLDEMFYRRAPDSARSLQQYEEHHEASAALARLQHYEEVVAALTGLTG